MSEWRELKTLQDVVAAMDDGDEIEVDGFSGWEKWEGAMWTFNLRYRARPRQPKTMKLKIYGYIDTVTGRTFTVVRGASISSGVVPYPKLDDEIEVEE